MLPNILTEKLSLRFLQYLNLSDFLTSDLIRVKTEDFDDDLNLRPSEQRPNSARIILAAYLEQMTSSVLARLHFYRFCRREILKLYFIKA